MKKYSKYLVVALGAALLALPAVQAEEVPASRPADGQREMNREKMGDKMADELGLTADQRAKMKEINQAQRAESEALRANTALSQEDKRARMETIRKSFMEKRQALMTPEQREKSKGMREKGEKRLDEQRKNKGERYEKPVEQK